MCVCVCVPDLSGEQRVDGVEPVMKLTLTGRLYQISVVPSYQRESVGRLHINITLT